MEQMESKKQEHYLQLFISLVNHLALLPLHGLRWTSSLHHSKQNKRVLNKTSHGTGLHISGLLMYCVTVFFFLHLPVVSFMPHCLGCECTKRLTDFSFVSKQLLIIEKRKDITRAWTDAHVELYISAFPSSTFSCKNLCPCCRLRLKTLPQHIQNIRKSATLLKLQYVV